MVVVRKLCLVPVMAAVFTNRVRHAKLGMATGQWSSVSDCLWNP